jgi:hypothetical protein
MGAEPTKPKPKKPVLGRTVEDEMDRLREQGKDDDQAYLDWKNDRRECEDRDHGPFIL